MVFRNDKDEMTTIQLQYNVLSVCPCCQHNIKSWYDIYIWIVMLVYREYHGFVNLLSGEYVELLYHRVSVLSYGWTLEWVIKQSGIYRIANMRKSLKHKNILRKYVAGNEYIEMHSIIFTTYCIKYRRKANYEYIFLEIVLYKCTCGKRNDDIFN